jgi:flagella basal body P-ring formation protein FlgA
MKTSIALKLSFILQASHANALFFLKHLLMRIVVLFTLLLSAGFSWSFNTIDTKPKENIDNTVFFAQSLKQQHIQLLDLSFIDNYDLEITLSNLHTTLLNQLPCTRENIIFKHTGKNTTGNVRYQAHCSTHSLQNKTTKKVTLNLNIKLFIPILLSKHALNANSTIDASDLYFKKTDISRLHTGYFTEISDIVGLDVRRTLPAGKILNPLLVQSPLLIDKGDEVIIWANVPGLTIKMTGIAMTSGRKGKQISVKNKSSGKIIKARVLDSALVEPI